MISTDGGNFNAPNQDRISELERIVELLITNGANCSLPSKYGGAPLDTAFVTGEFVQLDSERDCK